MLCRLSIRYMSKFRPMVVLEEAATKGGMKTMGPAKVELPSPGKYLKKHSKDHKHSESELSDRLFNLCVSGEGYCAFQPHICLPEKLCAKDVHHTCTTKKPAVPARTEIPPVGIHSKRDFIKTSIAVPMKPQPTCVDSNKGHKELLENSGLVPKYRKKKVFL